MKRGESLRAFASHYFGVIPPLGIIPASLRRRADTIDQVIVDSSVLSDGSLVFDRAWSFDAPAADVTHAALRATIGNTDERSRAIRNALVTETVAYDPIVSNAGELISSTWHHGSDFSSFWLGAPERLTHYCDVTESEREQIRLEARRANGEGSIVYAVATGISKTPPVQTPRQHHLTFVGLVRFHPNLYPGTLSAVAAMREAGIAIRYLSRDSAATVETLATLACIAPTQVIAYRPIYTAAPPLDQPLYAELSATTLSALTKKIRTPRTLRVDDPLPAFWRTFSRLRHDASGDIG